MNNVLIFNFDKTFEIDPFPPVTAGALYLNDHYVIDGAINIALESGAKNLYVASDAGGAFVREAVSVNNETAAFNIKYFTDLNHPQFEELLASLFMVDMAGINSPLLVLPGNIITELKYQDLHKAYQDKKKPMATVVCIMGVNETNLNCPAFYKPTEVAMLDPKLAKRLHLGGKRNLFEILESLDKDGKVEYYVFDGMFYEVSTPEDFKVLYDVSRAGVESFDE
jgi:hypothetical protein